MKILIAPYAQKMRNENVNPKNYPYWKELIGLLKDGGHTLIQIGVDGEEQLVDDFRVGLDYDQLKELGANVDLSITVDSFWQHFCWYWNFPCVVIWSVSDPKIFGHDENVNLLKDRKYLRKDQFNIWEAAAFQQDAFVSPDEVIKCLETMI